MSSNSQLTDKDRQTVYNICVMLNVLGYTKSAKALHDILSSADKIRPIEGEPTPVYPRDTPHWGRVALLLVGALASTTIVLWVILWIL
jgi:hypothetical protein